MSTVPSTSDLEDHLAEAADGPKRVQIANESVESHPLKDLADAASRVAAKAASTKAHQGIRFVGQRPLGAWD